MNDKIYVVFESAVAAIVFGYVSNNLKLDIENSQHICSLCYLNKFTTITVPSCSCYKIF